MVGRDHGPQTIWHETVATRPHRNSEQFRSAPRTFQPRHGRLSGRQTDTLTPPAGRHSGDAGTRRRGRKPDVRSEPAPVRRESRRRCRAFASLAAWRARAAAGDARGRISRYAIISCNGEPFERVSPRPEGIPDMSKARTSPSNTAGPRIGSIVYRNWQPTLCAGKSP